MAEPRAGPSSNGMTLRIFRLSLLLALSLGACGDDDTTNDPVITTDARPPTPDGGIGTTPDGAPSVTPDGSTGITPDGGL